MRGFIRLLLLSGLIATLPAAEPALKIVFGSKTVALTAEEFGALPHHDLSVADPHDQKERHYRGVAASELLARVGAPLGVQLRGSALQLAVVVRSRDGYAVVFSLADFDEAFSSRTLFLADQEDGQPLPANSAPFRLIAPGDKKAARWARMVTSLEVINVAASAATASTAVAPPPDPAHTH